MNALLLGGLIIFAFTMLAAFLGFWIVAWLRAHTLVIRDETNRKSYITPKLMVEAIDKETRERFWKNVWWQKKFRIPYPPKEAIDFRTKGRMYAECYRISDDEYAWITDKGVTITDEVIDGKTVRVLKDAKGNLVDTLQPFSKTQRAEMVHQFRKAQEFAKGWTPEKIMQVASLSVLGMIIICGLIFGGDIYKERQMALQVQQQTAVQLNENMIILGDIQENQKAILGIIGGNPNTPDKSKVIISQVEEPPKND